MSVRSSTRLRVCALLAALCMWNTAALAMDADGDGVSNDLDVCCNTPPGVPVGSDGRPIADLDEDCDVDLADQALLAASFTGPMAPNPGNGTPCDDGDGCTVGDVYVCGVCVGEAMNCDDGTACTVDSCVAGACVNDASGCGCMDAVDCDDGLGCTVDICVAGLCFHDEAGCGCSVDADCNDLNSCTTDTCDASLTCTNTPDDGAACSDGDPCSVGDVCAGGICSGGAINCDDGLACTTESCVAGVCVIDPAGCECTSAAQCNDGNGCTTDTCNADFACEFTPADGLACTDGDLCTVGDTCSGGYCAGTPQFCHDGIACTFDACNPATGACMFTVVGTTCLISEFCYESGEQEPGNECRMCLPEDSQTSWSAVEAGTACDDGDVNTSDDACDGAGNCVGTS